MAKRKASHEKWDIWPVLLVEVLGFCIAFYLLLISARVISPTTLPCPVNGIFACASIVRGKFSYIGPFSIAALGVIYFVAQLSLTSLARVGNWAAFLKGLMIAGGFFFLGWLRATEIVYLHKICPWCYAVCILTLVEAVLMWPALTLFVPRWGVVKRSFAVLGVFLLISMILCIPVYLLKTPENSFGRQYFPFDYAKIADGGEPIEHEIDLLPTNKQQTAKQTPVPVYTPSPQVSVSPVTQKPTDKPQVTLDESSRDSDETRVLRSRGWRVLANNESVKNAVKNHAPVLLLAFDPICDECSYLITKQLSNPITEDIPAFKIAVDYQQLRGDLAIAVDGVPMMLLIDGEGNILWKHKGRKDATSLVRDIKQILKP